MILVMEWGFGLGHYTHLVDHCDIGRAIKNEYQNRLYLKEVKNDTI